MRQEISLDARIDKVFQEKQYERRQRAIEKARTILGKLRVNPETFRDLYGNVNINADLAYVRRTRYSMEMHDTIRERQSKEIADTFEVILHEQVGKNKWLGENAFSVKTSEYDDIRNGVDSVTEFLTGPSSVSHLALGIDITFGYNLAKKFERIKEEIDAGNLTQVKYFVSPSQHFRGELKKIPRVVAGADIDSVNGLITLWLNEDDVLLKRHPVQLKILDEMKMQLEVFREYSKQRRPELVPVFQQRLNLIDSLVERKKDLRNELVLNETLDEEHDKVLSTIKSCLTSIFRIPTRL
ncbi:MAG: hypothetical protein HY001_02375 [Candidatus Portnoybacteria bacterium]|nr:hypothetical protein [Candidatus Portnoybacteria bacterium]